SQYKLQEIRQRFTRSPGQPILHWLYYCWCLGADLAIFVDGYEAKQLGSLSCDVALDRVIGRMTGTLSLWMRLVLSVRAVYTADELLVYRDRWNTKVEGVLYLTELTLADILFGNTQNNEYVHDPNGAYCTWPIWREFKKSAAPPYAKALASFTWKRNLKVQELQAYVWECIPTPSSPPQNSFSYVKMQPKQSDDPCTICYEELGRNSCELECGHEFHRWCIRTWLLENSSTCPICHDYAVLPADVPARPPRKNSKRYKAKPWKRSVF
ncbi:DZIP3 ligase, partial [Brachypodius atriceps]|nr:DZIP3 ligase [Brachypodius atriceps]